MCLASLLKAGKRQGWIDNYILIFTNALYNFSIGIKILKLQTSGRVINMDMNNRCPSTSTGNALRNQSFGCYRHERLSLFRPRAIQRSFNENRTCHIAIKSQAVLYVYLLGGLAFAKELKGCWRIAGVWLVLPLDLCNPFTFRNLCLVFW